MYHYILYHQHQLNVNPFDHLGEQDITADVDFESLNLVKKLNLNAIKIASSDITDIPLLSEIYKLKKQKQTKYRHEKNQKTLCYPTIPQTPPPWRDGSSE